jgi:D-alanyl-D-alanine carboxypeptidase
MVYSLALVCYYFCTIKKIKNHFMRNTPATALFNLRNLLFLSLLSFVVSCSKSDTGGGNTPLSPGSIVAFSFQKSATIPVTSTAALSGSSINIFLPAGTNPNALVATFTLSDSSLVTVNGVTQQSGITANDFSSPVTYTVSTKTGSKTYTVYLTTGIQPLDQNVAAFMQQYNIPGMSIAITLNDQLVYAQSYGQAVVETNTVATNQSQFRVSSLSKQITSAMVMKLIDQGKIHMTDKVFGPGAILGTMYGAQPYGPGIGNITVDNLLHCTSGGWLDDNTDPLGQNPSMSSQQIITWGLNNVPLLDTVPGRSYYYSHFGYVILGRVIEQITGMTYTQAAQQLVLQPSGITDMTIATNNLSTRQPNEVEYYSTIPGEAYGWNINREDAANGWIASATDMARFLTHVDGFSSQTLISPAAFQIMSTGSGANPSYACGWEVNQYNLFHHGSLPGTGTSQAITTQYGNFNYVILCNGNNGAQSFNSDMDNIFWNALPNITSWPTYNLF